MQMAFTVALVALAVIGGARRNAAQLWTPLILLANQAACSLVVYVTRDYYPVLFFVVADYAAAIGVVLVMKTRWQSAIIVIYALQIVCHAAYALTIMGPAQTYYGYWILTYLGWVQLALIGGWIGTALVGPRLSFLGRRPHKSSVDELASEKP